MESFYISRFHPQLEQKSSYPSQKAPWKCLIPCCPSPQPHKQLGSFQQQLPWEELPFPFNPEEGINTHSSCSGWDRGCGIFLSPLSPAGMLATTQVRRGGCLKRIWNLSKMALFHHAVESGRVVVIPPPQSHLPTSLLAQQ